MGISVRVQIVLYAKKVNVLRMVLQRWWWWYVTIVRVRSISLVVSLSLNWRSTQNTYIDYYIVLVRSVFARFYKIGSVFLQIANAVPVSNNNQYQYIPSIWYGTVCLALFLSNCRRNIFRSRQITNLQPTNVTPATTSAKQCSAAQNVFQTANQWRVLSSCCPKMIKNENIIIQKFFFRKVLFTLNQLLCWLQFFHRFATLFTPAVWKTSTKRDETKIFSNTLWTCGTIQKNFFKWSQYRVVSFICSSSCSRIATALDADDVEKTHTTKEWIFRWIQTITFINGI